MKNNYETLLLEHEAAVTTVTLNRPELHNAFNETMVAELSQVFSFLNHDGETRVVVLTGAGKSFCAGADLNWMKKIAGFTKKKNLADSEKFHQMLTAVFRCSKPVLAYVHGSTLGGGTGLVAAVDIALAEDDAVFGFSEVRLGLIPAVVSPWVIRKIGEKNAREYFLTGERFSAAKAQEMGLIQYHGASDVVREKLNEKIQMLKQGAPGALAECKRLIEINSSSRLEKLGPITATMIAKRRASAEGQEGIVAFLTKKKPNWVL